MRAIILNPGICLDVPHRCVGCDRTAYASFRRSGVREEAVAAVGGAEWPEWRHALSAEVLGNRAAGVEWATGGWLSGAGDVATEAWCGCRGRSR